MKTKKDEEIRSETTINCYLKCSKTVFPAVMYYFKYNLTDTNFVLPTS